MKKYLIKGLLALVVGGFVASCADDKVDYIPVGQQKATAYADAFKELIGGEVAPNHDWGFTKTSLVDESAASRTRAVDVNGNEWPDRPEVTDQERIDVYNYVNYTRYQMDHLSPAHIYYTEFPENIANYFVSQVYKGGDTYTDADGNGSIVGSNQMNNLHIKESSSGTLTRSTGTLSETGWYHVNNFNSGNNTDWGGNTLVVNSGTLDFAYHSSQDNKYHNRWIVVNGADIKPEYAGYYYVCFDFEAYYQDPTNSQTVFQLNFQTTEYNQDGTSYTVDRSANCEVNGFYTTADAIIGDGFTYSYNSTPITITPSMISNIRVIQGNMYVAPNDVYTDWIIRLVSASNGGSSSSSSSSSRTDRVERRRLVAQGRIFCEDLGTNEITTSDIDFNDAVFDAKIWRLGQYDVTYVNGNYSSETDYLTGIYTNGLENGKFKYIAEIRLLAAGGTVPLKIGGNNGFEIHAKFGEGNGRTIGHTTIINTMGAPSQANFTTTVQTDQCDAVTAEVDITSLVAGQSEIGLDIIPIEVQWVSQAGQTVGELSADYGKAPQKLCVPIGTPWVYERIPIAVTENREGAYADFGAYARNRTPLFWEGTKNESLLYPSNPEGMTAETGETGNVNTNPYHDTVVTEGTTTTTTVVETVLWEGEMTFGANDANQTIKLYSTTFDADNDIRIYGSSNGGQLTLQNSDAQNIISPSLNFSNVGYADSSVNESQAGQLSSGPSIIVVASNCTITKICKVVTTTN